VPFFSLVLAAIAFAQVFRCKYIAYKIAFFSLLKNISEYIVFKVMARITNEQVSSL
jgi:hypothetical protein